MIELSSLERKQKLMALVSETIKPKTIREQIAISYEPLIKNVLGDAPYLMYTVNLPRSLIGRELNKRRKPNGHLDERTLPFSQEFYNATRSGTPLINAYETMYTRFFRVYQQEVLGSRFKKHKQQLRWIRVYENPTKRFINEPISHVHWLIELPPYRIPVWYTSNFSELFGRLIFPLTHNTKILNIERGRKPGELPHTRYLMKQLNHWQVASDRLYWSDARSNSHIQ